MNCSFRLQSENNAPVRKLFAIALILGCAFGTAANATAQSIASPPTPTLITPEEGNSAFLLGRASGTQGYVCLPTSTGASRFDMGRSAGGVRNPGPGHPLVDYASRK